MSNISGVGTEVQVAAIPVAVPIGVGAAEVLKWAGIVGAAAAIREPLTQIIDKIIPDENPFLQKTGDGGTSSNTGNGGSSSKPQTQGTGIDWGADEHDPEGRQSREGRGGDDGTGYTGGF